MFVRLLPDQVERYWSAFEWAVEDSLPPMDVSNGRLTRILESILTGSMQAWVLYRIIEHKQVVKAILLTTITTEEWDNTFSLLVYAIRSFKVLDRKDMKEMLACLRLFAEESRCVNITAYIPNKRNRLLCEALGGKEVAAYMVIPLKEEDTK